MMKFQRLYLLPDYFQTEITSSEAHKSVVWLCLGSQSPRPLDRKTSPRAPPSPRKSILDLFLIPHLHGAVV